MRFRATAHSEYGQYFLDADYNVTEDPSEALTRAVLQEVLGDIISLRAIIYDRFVAGFPEENDQEEHFAFQEFCALTIADGGYSFAAEMI